MLVYVVTVATSAFFVPHYLSIFWGPLRENPWDIVGGIVVIVVLVVLNIVGVQEAAQLSITLAVIDFATQVLLVALGFVLVFSPEILVDNVHWGVAPTWGTSRSRSRSRCSPTRGWRPSPTSPRRCATRSRTSRRVQARRVAVFAIYFTLPLIALSALPVIEIDGELTTLLALPPEEGGYANDPILGVVQNLGVEGALLDALEIYVGILAATILFIATNAGVIGASRITYAMATYRQIPEVFRRLHPRFKTPWLSIVALRRRRADRGDPAGRRQLRRDALLVRRDALVHDRARVARPDADDAAEGGAALPRAAEPPHRRASTGRSSRSSAGSRPGSRSPSSSSRTRPRAGSASAGSRPGSSSTSSTGAGSCTRR